MSLQNVNVVARWEYHRFAKPRDLFLGTLFFMVMFGVFGFVGYLTRSAGEEEKTVGVLGGASMDLSGMDRLGRFRLKDWAGPDPGRAVELLGDPDACQALATVALEAEEIDALLVVQGPDEATLIVQEERGWQEELLAQLTSHRQTRRLQGFGLDAVALESLTAPVEIERVRVDAAAREGQRADPKTVLVVIGTMLLGLFLGFSYVFVAITGEKTQKVTESVLAAITPQEWIDGKILGLTLVVLANVICYAIGYLLYKAAAAPLLGEPFGLPVGIQAPLAFTWLLLFAMLGFGFWFTLFAIVAATINDPNSSSRSSLLFLPFLPLGLTLMGMDQADALWMRLLALLPGISPTAMPVRILRGNPHPLEIVLSLLLLLATVAIFRRTAGRIFGLSMLMTGKEPSWAEIWRWVRES